VKKVNTQGVENINTKWNCGLYQKKGQGLQKLDKLSKR
jgi:hypothetical protein